MGDKQNYSRCFAADETHVSAIPRNAYRHKAIIKVKRGICINKSLTLRIAPEQKKGIGWYGIEGKKKYRKEWDAALSMQLGKAKLNFPIFFFFFFFFLQTP